MSVRWIPPEGYKKICKFHVQFVLEYKFANPSLLSRSQSKKYDVGSLLNRLVLKNDQLKKMLYVFAIETINCKLLLLRYCDDTKKLRYFGLCFKLGKRNQNKVMLGFETKSLNVISIHFGCRSI